VTILSLCQGLPGAGGGEAVHSPEHCPPSRVPGAASVSQLLIPVRAPRRISLQNNKDEKKLIEHKL